MAATAPRIIAVKPPFKTRLPGTFPWAVDVQHENLEWRSRGFKSKQDAQDFYDQNTLKGRLAASLAMESA